MAVETCDKAEYECAGVTASTGTGGSAEGQSCHVSNPNSGCAAGLRCGRPETPSVEEIMKKAGDIIPSPAEAGGIDTT